MLDQILNSLQTPWIRATAIVLGSAISAYLTEIVFRRVVVSLVNRTETEVDDRIAESLRRPIFFSVLLMGIAWAVTTLGPSKQVSFVIFGALKTIATLIWAVAWLSIGGLVYHALALRTKAHALIQPRTEPIFNIATKLIVIAAATYFVLIAWKINVTAWLASAGVAGIAIGFAAKDTLANLFAGIFIVADSPYKVGDFIVLDDTQRGRVTAIGFRSTRLLTLDDVEIIIPNGVLGNARIVNETGGPHGNGTRIGHRGSSVWKRYRPRTQISTSMCR